MTALVVHLNKYIAAGIRNDSYDILNYKLSILTGLIQPGLMR